MKTFIINLDKDKERLANTFACLQSIGCKASDTIRVPAIYGKSLSETEVCAVVKQDRLSKISMSRAMIGCAMSHMKVWQMIVDDESISEEDGRAFIVEDDVFLVSPFAFSEIEVSFPAVADAELLYLGYIRGTLDCFGLVNAYTPSSSWYRFHYPYGLSSYVISKQGARRLLRYVQDQGGFTKAIDIMIVNAMQADVVRAFIHRPQLLSQASNTNNDNQLTSSTIVSHTYPTFMSWVSNAMPTVYKENVDISLSAWLATICYDLGNEHQITQFDCILFLTVLFANFILPFWLFLVLICLLLLLLSNDLVASPRHVAQTLQVITLANSIALVVYMLYDLF